MKDQMALSNDVTGTEAFEVADADVSYPQEPLPAPLELGNLSLQQPMAIQLSFTASTMLKALPGSNVMSSQILSKLPCNQLGGILCKRKLQMIVSSSQSVLLGMDTLSEEELSQVTRSHNLFGLQEDTTTHFLSKKPSQQFNELMSEIKTLNTQNKPLTQGLLEGSSQVQKALFQEWQDCQSSGTLVVKQKGLASLPDLISHRLKEVRMGNGASAPQLAINKNSLSFSVSQPSSGYTVQQSENQVITLPNDKRDPMETPRKSGTNKEKGRVSSSWWDFNRRNRTGWLWFADVVEKIKGEITHSMDILHQKPSAQLDVEDGMNARYYYTDSSGLDEYHFQL